MKGLLKKISILTLALVLLLPIFVNASEVTNSGFESLTLEQALEEEQIAYSFSHTDNANQVVIYLFRGKGCGYCHKFLEYAANTLMPNYGDKIRFVTYEVWYNETNGALYQGIAEMLGTNAEGVPFIVIGNKYFTGYAESMNSEIEAQINSEYSSSNRYDAIEEYAKYLNNKNNGSSNVTGKVDLSDAIIWNFIFTAVSTIIILVFVNNKFNKLTGKTDEDADEYDEPEIEEKKTKRN